MMKMSILKQHTEICLINCFVGTRNSSFFRGRTHYQKMSLLPELEQRRECDPQDSRLEEQRVVEMNSVQSVKAMFET